jgi:hypothetical protein
MSAKEVGERLAKEAASSGIGSKQLRQLFTITQTRTLDHLDAFIKYQIGRNVRGFDKIGPELLKLIEEHRNDKPFAIDTLRYVCLTTDYYRIGEIRKLEPQIESVVKRIGLRYGYRRTELSSDDRGTRMNVYLDNFHGDSRGLSEDIHRELAKNIQSLREGDFEVWINPRRR